MHSSIEARHDPSASEQRAATAPQVLMRPTSFLFWPRSLFGEEWWVISADWVVRDPAGWEAGAMAEAGATVEADATVGKLKVWIARRLLSRQSRPTASFLIRPWPDSPQHSGLHGRTPARFG